VNDVSYHPHPELPACDRVSVPNIRSHVRGSGKGGRKRRFPDFFSKKSKAQGSSLSTEEIPLVDITDLPIGSQDENTEISFATKNFLH
jgi:hypothetical protein